jgi:hypothetical protein
MAPPPRKKRSGPGLAIQDRPAKSAPAIAAKQQDEGTVVPSLGGRGLERQYPRADASLYEPVPGRGLVALPIRCPRCRGVHLGRVRPGTKPGGVRRTPCGVVEVVIRRTYRASGAAA